MKAKEVRALRAALGMTRAEFGRLVGVSDSLVFKWEAGSRAVQGPALRLLRHEQRLARRRQRSLAARKGVTT